MEYRAEVLVLPQAAFRDYSRNTHLQVKIVVDNWILCCYNKHIATQHRKSFMTAQHRTFWNTGELQALHKWIAQQDPLFAQRPVTDQVILAQKAVLPVERQRTHVKYFTHATMAMARIQAASRIISPTAQQTAQSPAFVAPLTSVPCAAMPVVYVQHGTTVVMGMPPGKYVLEVM